MCKWTPYQVSPSISQKRCANRAPTFELLARPDQLEHTCQVYVAQYTIPGARGKKGKKNGTPKKKTEHSGDRTLDWRCSWSETYLFKHSVSFLTLTHIRLLYLYTCEYTLGIATIPFNWKKKKKTQHPPPGDNASMAEAAPGRVGRGEQGEALWASSTPKTVDLISSYSRPFTAQNLV